MMRNRSRVGSLAVSADDDAWRGDVLEGMYRVNLTCKAQENQT